MQISPVSCNQNNHKPAFKANLIGSSAFREIYENEALKIGFKSEEARTMFEKLQQAFESATKKIIGTVELREVNDAFGIKYFLPIYHGAKTEAGDRTAVVFLLSDKVTDKSKPFRTATRTILATLSDSRARTIRETTSETIGRSYAFELNPFSQAYQDANKS